MIKSTVRAVLLSATALAAAPGWAEDVAESDRDYLGTNIVVTGMRDGYASDDGSTATKTPTPLIDVPQAVTVITRDQLDDQNVRQLGEALRYVPGVSLGTGEGHRDQVMIRGQSTTADFYVDGLRDDAQYYRPLYNVERIEVLKGANALIFGRGAGGGAINRVTKTADPMMAFGEAGGSIDSFGAWNLAGDYNAPLGESFAARLNATYERLDNHRDVYEGRFFGVSPTVTALLGPDTELTATYSYDDDERVVDRGIPSLAGRPIAGFDEVFFGDPDYNDSFARVHIARTRLDHAFSDAVSFNATVQYANYDKFYANIVPETATTTTVRLSGYESGNTRENLIGQANLIAQLDSGPVGHTILLGAEAMSQDSTALRNNARFSGATTVTVPLGETIAVPAFTLVPQSASRSDLATLAFYAQDQIDFGLVQLVAGVRYDRFDIDTVNTINGFAATRVDERWSPRLGLIVEPSDEVSLYASYSQSFLPQSGDQFSVLSPVTAALDPEEFENLEAGVKWAIRPNLLLTGAVFRLDRTNSQAPDPQNPGAVLLTGETRVEGFEAGLAGEILPSLQVNLGYTYLDGEIRSTTTNAPAGRRLQQLPRHQIGAWARYEVTERLGVALGLLHQSKQFTTLSNAVTLPAYTRVDAAVYFDVTERVGLQLNVENLLDEDYYPSAHTDNNIQPGEPLNATLSAKVKF